MKTRAALLLLAALTASAHAEVYQWKDEQGRIHFGQEVPPKYQKSAVVKDTTQVNVMKAAEAAKPQSNSETPAPPREEVDEDAPVQAEEGCAAELQKYEETQACLKKFLNAYGRVTTEGVQKCGSVPRPDCVLKP
jgi:hypothetical protein